MFDNDQQERTEQPTQARLEEARREGRVPRSQDLVAAASLLAGFVGLYWAGPALMSQLVDSVRRLLLGMSPASGTVTPPTIGLLSVSIGSALALIVLPAAACAGAGAIAASVVQTGFVVRGAAVLPDGSRMGIRRGLGRILSLRSLVRGLFALLKVLAVGLAVAWLAWSALDGALAAWGQQGIVGDSVSLRQAWGSWSRELLAHGIRFSLLLLALGVLQYLFERRQHHRELQMTRAEVQEELLRLEGNREMKSQRRKEGSALVEKARRGELPGRGE